MDDLDKTMDVIQTEVKKDDKKKIIGIAGCSGCGKSYFAQQLCDFLNKKGIRTIVIKYDDFITLDTFNDRGQRLADDVMLQKALTDIMGGRHHITKPIWLTPTSKSTENVWIHEVKVFLLEGTTVLADDNNLRPFLSFGIFIEAFDSDIWKWRWQREKTNVSYEQFEIDMKLEMSVYRNFVEPTKRNAKFVICKDKQHRYVVFKSAF